jgi:hypothetical protein
MEAVFAIGPVSADHTHPARFRVTMNLIHWRVEPTQTHNLKRDHHNQTGSSSYYKFLHKVQHNKHSFVLVFIKEFVNFAKQKGKSPC